MEMVSAGPAIAPPWGHPNFLSEEGLKAAQEYYFQTHASNSRRFAEGRNAQGVTKSFVRRKLTRELGEDFKMYTGTSIGEAAGENMESLGIRGELNGILKHIYTRIAPNQPIASPIQQDLTIVKHPNGALEVCYALVYHYGALLKKYASLAGKHRKVLKAVMEEELFKWIWRLTIGFVMSPQEDRAAIEDAHLSAGLNCVPLEQQHASVGQKIHEIGMFLLGTIMQDSHLRVPLCHYYVLYLQRLQSVLTLKYDRGELDEVYSQINRRVEGDALDHPLVAIDALMNGKGSTMQSFDDVVVDEQQLLDYVPRAEVEFISQFADQSSPKQLASMLKRLVPDVRRHVVEEQESSLMPLLLTLRTLPAPLRDAALAALPVPILHMLRNRISSAAVDDVARTLSDRIKETMEAKRGDSYSLRTRQDTGKAAVASSVRVAPPSRRTSSAGVAQGTPDTPAATAPAAASTVVEAPPAEQPAPDAPTAASTVAEAPPAKQAVPLTEAARETVPTPPPGGAVHLEWFDKRSMLAWRLDGARLSAISLSARELMELVGGEMRFLLPWLVYALRTGQVFDLAPDQISKETVEELLLSLRMQGTGEARSGLSKEQLDALPQQGKTDSHAKLLLALANAGGLENFTRIPDSMVPSLESLSQKFGEKLGEFVRQPTHEDFQEPFAALSNQEKQALSLLRRVARAQ